jgi:hypothetical protein
MGFIIDIFINVRWFIVFKILHNSYSLFPFSQVLGRKPELPDGDNDDDVVADISNRKMAKLYMVSSWGGILSLALQGLSLL